MLGLQGFLRSPEVSLVKPARHHHGGQKAKLLEGVNSRLRPAELGAVTFWMNAVWSGEVRHDAIGTVRDHPKGVYRSVLKRAIRSVLIGSPDASDSQVCDGLDELDIPSDTGGKAIGRFDPPIETLSGGPICTVRLAKYTAVCVRADC